MKQYIARLCDSVHVADPNRLLEPALRRLAADLDAPERLDYAAAYAQWAIELFGLGKERELLDSWCFGHLGNRRKYQTSTPELDDMARKWTAKKCFRQSVTYTRWAGQLARSVQAMLKLDQAARETAALGKVNRGQRLKLQTLATRLN